MNFFKLIQFSLNTEGDFLFFLVIGKSLAQPRMKALSLACWLGWVLFSGLQWKKLLASRLVWEKLPSEQQKPFASYSFPPLVLTVTTKVCERKLRFGLHRKIGQNYGNMQRDFPPPHSLVIFKQMAKCCKPSMGKGQGFVIRPPKMELKVFLENALFPRDFADPFLSW